MQENELTKLKIRAEFGIDFNEESNLSPAVENVWLNNILEFERSMKNNEKISLRNHLGDPPFIPVEQLNDESLIFELHRIMELLHKKSIVIDSVAGVDDRTLYKFITTELFDVEVDSNMPKNMMCCFIYEEFHPNDEYDIRTGCEDFLRYLGNPDADDKYVGWNWLRSDDDESQVRKENIIRKLKLFKEAFDKIEETNFNFMPIMIKEESATVYFTYEITVYPPGSSKQVLKGAGHFEFIKKDDFWNICDFGMESVV
jgi:hypothetical protein